ncbi:MAG: acetoacetate decarboxylase family protein, partial [Polyangiales bacterium]
MKLRGWTLPQTGSGRSSIVAPPPWHYSGEIIAVDFTADRDAVAALLPDGFAPLPDGAASVVFADWCSASDNDERVLADPGVGQYHEAYVVLHATRGDRKVGRVPFIWVDSELSLLRGQIQGFPKKLGQIAMTRPVSLGRGGVRKAEGSTFAAHATSHGRRV